MAPGDLPFIDGQTFAEEDANLTAGFGDGSDGAFDESAASTTNLVQGQVYQYTSFNLGASHTISASGGSNKPIIILVQGNVTINGTIDLAGKGHTTSYFSASDTKLVTPGTNGGDNNGAEGAGGKKGLPSWNHILGQKGIIFNGVKGGNGGIGGGSGGGAGGGGGASARNDGAVGSPPSSGGTSGSGGAGGGAGGCSLLMVIGGTLTFGAASSIDCSGLVGAAGTTGGGGGGGSGSGDILIYHKGTKTDSGLSTDITGGSGGAGAGLGGAGGVGGAGAVSIVEWTSILY